MPHGAWIIEAEILASFGIMICGALLWHMRTVRYAQKLASELPIWDWLTIDELARRGYRRGRCERAVPYLHRRGHLEVRLNSSFSSEKREEIRREYEIDGKFYFSEMTVPFFEFSLTRRPGGGARRGRRLSSGRLADFLPGFAPVPVRMHG